jgi:hypothetical protein
VAYESLNLGITFYFKEGCLLCDHAEEMITGVMKKYGMRKFESVEVRKKKIGSNCYIIDTIKRPVNKNKSIS